MVCRSITRLPLVEEVSVPHSWVDCKRTDPVFVAEVPVESRVIIPEAAPRRCPAP